MVVTLDPIHFSRIVKESLQDLQQPRLVLLDRQHIGGSFVSPEIAILPTSRKEVLHISSGNNSTVGPNRQMPSCLTARLVLPSVR